MKLTKYSHACLVLEKDGTALVIDPGVWSTDVVIPRNVVGVVITHEHQDHVDQQLLESIVSANPDVVVYGHESVVSQLANVTTQAVSADESLRVGSFDVAFYGGEHALIHESIPRVANLGVMVDETLYFPGDSYSPAPVHVPVLALPIAAPWMKLAEAMDFVLHTKPDRAFPTHDAILSETGQGLTDTMIDPIAKKAGTVYERIASGQSIEL